MGQEELLEQVLPRVAVPENVPLNAETLFGDTRPLVFEIGFGGGEHMAALALANPHMGFIGCEPFLNGVVSALTHIQENRLENVRLHMGDALGVLNRLPDESLSELYLLHPDPWPKARHAKRRMMNPGPLNMFAAKLRPQGRFRFGTDHPIYMRWAMLHMAQCPHFTWQAHNPQDFLLRPADWPETRYERKARRLGHEIWYCTYIKTGLA
jgi:tRNA (guanine-N7-)-methyltransferase